MPVCSFDGVPVKLAIPSLAIFACVVPCHWKRAISPVEEAFDKLTISEGFASATLRVITGPLVPTDTLPFANVALAIPAPLNLPSLSTKLIKVPLICHS